MKRAAVVVVLLLAATSCWRPMKDTTEVRIGVYFDADVSPQMQAVAWAELGAIDANFHYHFWAAADAQAAGLFDRLNIHGHFPERDDYPAQAYVDHATITRPDGVDETWRADVYYRPTAVPADLVWGIDTAMSY